MMAAWVNCPNAPGFWEADVPGFGSYPLLQVVERDGRLMCWVPRVYYYRDTSKNRGERLMEVDDPNCLDWFWKRVEVPDYCPLFDAEDDPK